MNLTNSIKPLFNNSLILHESYWKFHHNGVMQSNIVIDQSDTIV